MTAQARKFFAIMFLLRAFDLRDSAADRANWLSRYLVPTLHDDATGDARLIGYSMEISRRDLVRGSLAVALARAAGASNSTPTGYLKPVHSHLQKLLTQGTDVYGPVKTPMWMASLDIKTGRYPDTPDAVIGQRVYREIAAPKGSSLYWDQPEMVAAYALSRLTGEARFKHSVDDYVKYFVAHGIDENGLFEWGNHRYYDAFTDKFVRFDKGPHEIRPLTPAWELLWEIAPEATEREIRVTGKRHLVDPATGLFNRHDDGKVGCAFLEAGGVLVESLCWLAKKTGDRTLVQTALLIARFSFNNRNSETGLIENDPTVTRWDKFVCTTEIGLWAGCLLRASDASGKPEFAKMADEAMSAYLKYGYDTASGEYFGQLQVKDGKPPAGKPDTQTPTTGPKATENYRHLSDGTMTSDGYYPGHYADIWNALFPSHDYPMVFAETCVDLYRRTRAPRYQEAVERWVGVVKKHPAPASARDGRGAYAEMFGRVIQFLTDAGQTFHDPAYTALARKCADDSVTTLFAYGMFRGHASENRYDAVDGVGYLLLALIYLQTGKKPDYMGFGI